VAVLGRMDGRRGRGQTGRVMPACTIFLYGHGQASNTLTALPACLALHTPPRARAERRRLLITPTTARASNDATAPLRARATTSTAFLPPLCHHLYTLLTSRAGRRTLAALPTPGAARHASRGRAAA